ncbi:MAG TPA: phosphatase PAP2 family protein [Candidatus Eisenbacteria bacterium]|nr:phosphatase PAP2 family protein [Candidatus Eisenbacteria bacterium]
MKKHGPVGKTPAEALTLTAAYRGEPTVWNREFGMGERVWTAIRREFTAAWAACGAFEWWAFGYFGISSALIVLFAEHLQHPVRVLLLRAGVVGVILCLCRIQSLYAQRNVDRSASFAARWWHFWRFWYPHLLFLFCFEELAQLMTLFQPHWQDAKLIAFDYWLTGVHPSVWLEQFVTPGRNDFMQFAYLTYFVYLVVLGGILYVRREWFAYWSVMTYSMVGYSIGYLIAMSFPIESPWFAMAGWWGDSLHGGGVTATINFIEHYGKVRGAAFPSEHVAGSIAVLWGAWRFRRWLFWMMVPLVFLMCVSTIWGRYHYIADIFGGIFTGTLGYFIGSWWMQRKGAVKTAGAGLLPSESVD